MTDHELEQRLRAWYRSEIPGDEATPPALRSRVATIPQVTLAPLDRVGPRRELRLLAVAAVLTAAAVGGALLAGSRGVWPPSVVAPSYPTSTEPSPALTSPEPSPALTSPEPSRDVHPSDLAEAGRIVYTREELLANGEGGCRTRFVYCHDSSVFISDVDGSAERELLPGSYSSVLAASRDGSRLIVSIRDDVGQDDHYLTDTNGSTPQRLETRCVALCHADGSFAFSPDGSRLAFVRTRTDVTSVIAIMDMASGAVTELASTIGYAAWPGWSPDGSRLVFANHVVDADGSNFEQIAPDNLFTGTEGEFSAGLAASQWSPDGSLIALTSYNDIVTTVPPGNSQRFSDIYVVRPDGTELRRLTTDTVPPFGTTEAGDFGAGFPTWTSDGRIVFTRLPMPPEKVFELWAMDRDGSHATQLDPSNAAALTRLGCVACTYPALGDQYIVQNFGFWIPAP